MGAKHKTNPTTPVSLTGGMFSVDVSIVLYPVSIVFKFPFVDVDLKNPSFINPAASILHHCEK